MCCKQNSPLNSSIHSQSICSVSKDSNAAKKRYRFPSCFRAALRVCGELKAPKSKYIITLRWLHERLRCLPGTSFEVSPPAATERTLGYAPNCAFQRRKIFFAALFPHTIYRERALPWSNMPNSSVQYSNPGGKKPSCNDNVRSSR